MNKFDPTFSESLVFTDETPADYGSPPFAECELAFLLSDGDRLHGFPLGLAEDFTDSLAQAVAAWPADLSLHVRRIFHCYEREDDEGLCGALADLFIILGAGGRRLRRRLLEGTRQRLGEDFYQALASSLKEGGAIHENNLPLARDSVLRIGFEGGFDLVHLAASDSAAGRDPLTEAREYIEYSQLDQAREVLENAVELNPQRYELHDELLSLYRATGDEQNFLLMRDKLEEQLGGLPQAWREAQQTLCGGDES